MTWSLLTALVIAQAPASAPKPDQAFSGRPLLKRKNETTAPTTMPIEPRTRTPMPRHATLRVSRMLMSRSIRTMNIGTAHIL